MATGCRGRWPGAKRRIFLAFLGLLLSIYPAYWGVWRVYATVSSARAQHMGQAKLTASSEAFEHTVVVPTLDVPVKEGENIIWCASMQLAWNALSDLVGESIHMEREAPQVEALNRREVTKDDLDERTYSVVANTVGSGTHDTLREQLEDRFGSSVRPTLLDKTAELPPDALIAYAYLSANLPFEWAFERMRQPMLFKNKKVKSFGLLQYFKSHEKERLASRQLRYYDVRAEHDVIMELKTINRDHRLFIAKLPREGTLKMMTTQVLERVASSVPQVLAEGDSFIVPILDFDITRVYSELTGRQFKLDRSELNGSSLDVAMQQIRFKLDERGAVLESQAVVATLGMPMLNLIFNQPFLVMLVYKDSQVPYFAMWVDNPEVLLDF